MVVRSMRTYRRFNGFVQSRLSLEKRITINEEVNVWMRNRASNHLAHFELRVAPHCFWSPVIKRAEVGGREKSKDSRCSESFRRPGLSRVRLKGVLAANERLIITQNE